jgi:hypothetical protein
MAQGVSKDPLSAPIRRLLVKQWDMEDGRWNGSYAHCFALLPRIAASVHKVSEYTQLASPLTPRCLALSP